MPLPVAQIGDAEPILLLPLKTPITPPLVLTATGAKIWDLLLEAGAVGIDVESIADRIADDLGAEESGEAARIAWSFVPFLNELVEQGVAAVFDA